MTGPRSPRTQVAVECSWRSAGEVVLDGGGLRMPALPDEPGVYQWVLRHDGRERRYVGEAERLRQRFRGYRTPGSSQVTNLRMKERALRVLEAGGSVEILLAVDVRFVLDGEAHEADLSSPHARRLVENAALVSLLAEMGELVNDKGYGSLQEDPVLR